MAQASNKKTLTAAIRILLCVFQLALSSKNEAAEVAGRTSTRRGVSRGWCSSRARPTVCMADLACSKETPSRSRAMDRSQEFLSDGM